MESSKKETTIKSLNILRLLFQKIIEIRSYKPIGTKIIEDLDKDPKVAIYKQVGLLIILYNFF